ncbi:hypothetical protein LJC32_07135 [Oscillospiraceae bacterium OttesenSCG-928-F05]|nr:hypothetical protein [Oscillospiraceae bacterium OttesenSCG-928-F05]
MRRVIALLAVLMIAVSLTVAGAVPGSQSDPVLSLSYIQNVFIPQIEAGMRKSADERFAAAIAAAEKTSEQMLDSRVKSASVTKQQLQDAAVYRGTLALYSGGRYLRAPSKQTVTVRAGERILISPGSSLTLQSGAARLVGPAGAAVINTTYGGPSDVNSAVLPRSRYVAAEGHVIGFHSTADSAIVVEGYYQIVPAFQPSAAHYAFALKSLDLFRGSNLGFELEREGTRLEAVIMLLRLIGEEEQALAYTGTHPYTDVPYWAGDTANKYVAYAYARGYTKGISNTLFGSYNTITAEQYMTFLLRALGYQDGTDFQWKTSLDKGVALKILSAEERTALERFGFYRDDIARTSWRALYASRKAGGTLGETLAAQGLFTKSALEEAAAGIPGK